MVLHKDRNGLRVHALALLAPFFLLLPSGSAFAASVTFAHDLDLQQSERSGGTPCLIVELEDHTDLGPCFLRQVQSEVSVLFSRAGILVIWLDDRHSSYRITGRPFEAQVRILDRLSPWFESHSEFMAHVFRDRSGKPAPIALVSRESIEEYIGMGTRIPARFLSRGLSRVIAHELAHRFLQSSEHTEFGILRDSYTRRELIQPLPKGFHFTRQQVELIYTYAPRLDELIPRIGP